MCSLIKKLSEDLDEQQLITESDEESNEEESVSTQPGINPEAFTIAKQIRHVIQTGLKTRNDKVDDEMMDISYQSVQECIPVLLYNFIACIISTIDPDHALGEKIELSKQKHEMVLNIAQDLMYAVVKSPMPKHIGLALHVLRQTRSKDLVTILNRFGHCISYDEAQRYINAMAHHVDAQSQEHEIFVPFGVTKDKFVHFALDNLDFAEDSKDG